MHINTQLNQIVPLKWSFLFIVIVFQLVVSACGVAEKKNPATETSPSGSEEKITTSPAETGASSITGKDKDNTAAGEKNATDTQASAQAQTENDQGDSANADTNADTNAEVIEPKNLSRPDIKLVPIPATQSSPSEAPASTSADSTVAGSKTATAEESKEPEKIAKIEPAISKPRTPQTPVTSQANHFVITVGKKDRRHPRFGEGHDMGFLINGQSAQLL